MDYYIPPEYKTKQEQKYAIAYNAQDQSSWSASHAYNYFFSMLDRAFSYPSDNLEFDLKKARGWIDLLIRLKEIISLEQDFNKILKSDTPNLEKALKIKATIRLKKSDIVSDFKGTFSDVDLTNLNYY